MRQIFGDNAMNSMEEIEEKMMGLENHERAEELMDKMFDGTMTVDEQKEMVKMMSDPKTGQGMMMEMMMGVLPKFHETSSNDRWNMGRGGMMNWGFGFQWSYWISLILFWLLLAAGIFWLVKKAKK